MDLRHLMIKFHLFFFPGHKELWWIGNRMDLFSLCFLLFPNKVLKLKWHPLLLDYDLSLVWWLNVFSWEIWQSQMWVRDRVSYGNIKTWCPCVWCHCGFPSQVHSTQSEINKYFFPLLSLLWQMLYLLFKPGIWHSTPGAVCLERNWVLSITNWTLQTHSIKNWIIICLFFNIIIPWLLSTQSQVQLNTQNA